MNSATMAQPLPHRLIATTIPTTIAAMPTRPSPLKAQRAAATQADPRWASVLARSAAADGSFWFSVQTTGVYCRPSCAARTPRPENVQFHASCDEAERAGFRPCQRCKPRQSSALAHHTALVADACRYLDDGLATGRPPTLEALAQRLGLSASHLHRIFKQATGLTPRAYAAARRAARLRDALSHPASGSVTDAIYGAGYQSSSRFYEQSAQVLGMAPSRYRAGGAAQEIRYAVGPCSLGSVLVAQSTRGICAILLGDAEGAADALVRDLQARFPRAQLQPGDAAFAALVAQVVAFVEAPGLGLALPVDVRGTAFQQRVWQALQAIPAGQTASYAEIAQRIGAPTAVRAVARACAANALAVAVPCHRVVKSDGGLSGYRWGVERKRALLQREAEGAAAATAASAVASAKKAT